VKTPDDLPPDFLDHLKQFWVDKDRLEGKVFNPLGVGGPRAATKLVKLATKRARQAG
jgi:hypothetical protein